MRHITQRATRAAATDTASITDTTTMNGMTPMTDTTGMGNMPMGGAANGAMPDTTAIMDMGTQMQDMMAKMQGMEMSPEMKSMMDQMQGMMDSMMKDMPMGGAANGAVPDTTAMMDMGTQMQDMMAQMQGMDMSPEMKSMMDQMQGMMDSMMKDMPMGSAANGAMPGMAQSGGSDSMAGMSGHGMESIPSAGVPAATQSTGGQPLDFKLEDGFKVFELTATPVIWNITDNVTVTAWTYNGTVPGPMLREP